MFPYIFFRFFWFDVSGLKTFTSFLLNDSVSAWLKGDPLTSAAYLYLGSLGRSFSTGIRSFGDTAVGKTNQLVNVDGF